MDWQTLIVGLGIMLASVIGFFSYYDMYGIAEEDEEGNQLPWKNWSLLAKINSVRGLSGFIVLFLFGLILILCVIINVFR